MEINQEMFDLAEKVGQHLASRKQHLAIAESCTGGWIAKAVTDVPGSSDWFHYGFVTYSNEAKEGLLGVKPGTLNAEGAVSEATVLEMATGVLDRAGADVGLAVSGIAGPAGEAPGKPVGLVWFAWAKRRGMAVDTVARMKFIDGDRNAIRRKSVIAALQGLLEL